MEGPPGPEGPAVSDALSTLCSGRVCVALGRWMPGDDAGCPGTMLVARGGLTQHTAALGLYCFHMPRMCTERFGVDFLVQK